MLRVYLVESVFGLVSLLVFSQNSHSYRKVVVRMSEMKFVESESTYQRVKNSQNWSLFKVVIPVGPSLQSVCLVESVLG